MNLSMIHVATSFLLGAIMKRVPKSCRDWMDERRESLRIRSRLTRIVESVDSSAELSCAVAPDITRKTITNASRAFFMAQSFDVNIYKGFDGKANIHIQENNGLEDIRIPPYLCHISILLYINRIEMPGGIFLFRSAQRNVQFRTRLAVPRSGSSIVGD